MPDSESLSVPTLENYYPVVNVPGTGPCVLVSTAKTVKFSEGMSMEAAMNAMNKQLNNHESVLASCETSGHIKLGAGFERADDGTVSVVPTLEGFVRRPLSTSPMPGAVPVAGADGTLLKTWLPHMDAFVGQWVFLRQTRLPAGYVELNGTLYTDASTKFPNLVAYLEENQDEITTETDWKARSAAASGIGGVPFYVHDAVANTLRMPDTRGDSPYHGSVGTWKGDAMRKVVGSAGSITTPTPTHSTIPQKTTGAFFFQQELAGAGSGTVTATLGWYKLFLDSSKVVPTDSTNHPRRIGLTLAVYAGITGAL